MFNKFENRSYKEESPIDRAEKDWKYQLNLFIIFFVSLLLLATFTLLLMFKTT